MISFKFLAGPFSKLNGRSRLALRARRHRGRGKPACRFTADVLFLEERQLMAHGHADTPLEMPLAKPGVPNQYNTVNSLSEVLWTGDSNFTVPLTKEITFRNNTDHTVYPFLYNANTGKATGYGYYDPFDKNNQEYRLYVGYSVGNTYYLGLQKHAQVTLSVPLVFWDSGRADIATSDRGFLPKDPATSKNTAITNPFFFFYKNIDGSSTSRFVAPAVSSENETGVVMYYHCTDPDQPVNPGVDAPAQLIEYTIRDLKTMQYINQKYPNSIPNSQVKSLINYDVSYVDHLLLPVAMEATDVPVPNTTDVQPYGWIGSNKLTASLQDVLKEFTSDTPKNGLGTYFRDKGKDLGWPTFYDPSVSTAGIKIPGGANLLFSSPLANKRSNYDTNRWMLSSGGDEPIQFSGGGKFYTGPNRAVLSDSPGEREIIKHLRPGMTVSVNNVVQGTIDRVDIPKLTIYLKGSPSLGNDTPQSFVFYNPATDPYASKLTNLWYSWAQYYQSLPKFKDFGNPTLTANVSSDTDNNKSDYRILTIAEPHPKLEVGMQVQPTSGGIPPLITIMKIQTVNNVTQYYLSRPLPNVSAPGQVSLRFRAPQPIAFGSQTTDIPISFKDKSDAEQKFAEAFSATAYELMSVYSTATIRDKYLPASMGVVANVLGGNVGFLPTAEPIDYVNISADARDLGKSALRGVPDFLDYTTGWYPDPAEPTGDQTYNVFNLDPFVWFVHKRLDLSGYGFSFDDDTADVNADGSDKLYVAIGGPQGLPNKEEWKPSAPWGPQESRADILNNVPGYQGKTIIALANKTVYNQLKANDFINGVVGAYVTGDGIEKGTNLAATANIDQNQFVLSEPAAPAQHVLLHFSADKPK